MDCLICKIRAGKTLFRGSFICGRCNNIEMNRLKYQREKGKAEKRWQIWGHGQNLGRLKWRGWLHLNDEWVLGVSYAFGHSFCHLYFQIDPNNDHLFSSGFAVPGAAIWINLEVPWNIQRHFENESKTGISVFAWKIWINKGKSVEKIINILGKETVKEIKGEKGFIIIKAWDLNNYQCSYEKIKYRYRYSKLPWMKWERDIVSIDIEGGIPFKYRKAKWGNEMEILYGYSCTAKTVKEAILKLLKGLEQE